MAWRMALLAGRRKGSAKLAARLCAAALLALALYAVAPSGAAASASFEATDYIATISGESTAAHELTLEGEVKVKCSKVTFSGELDEPSASLAVTPSFSECTAGGLSATVKANECRYVLKGSTETAENQFSGTTDVSCPIGQSIVVVTNGGKCEAGIGTQTGLSTVTYHSEHEATPPNVKVEQKLTSMHYTVSKDEGTCTFAGTGEKTNGNLNATSTLKAASESESEALSIGVYNSTQLCSAAPKAKSFACPVGSGLGANQTVKGSVVKPSVATLFLLQKGNPKPQKFITCQSNFSFETTAAQANPLPLAKFLMEFPKGTCQTTPGGTACEVTPTAPATPNLNASFNNAGQGTVQIVLTMKIECGTEVEGCEYKTGTGETTVLLFKGATTAEFVTSDSLPLPVIAAKKNCFDTLELGENYTVSAPNKGAVWVTP